MSESQDASVNLLIELQTCWIDPQEDVQEPPMAITIRSEEGEIPSFTLGNFSMVIGKAKSKKTDNPSKFSIAVNLI